MSELLLLIHAGSTLCMTGLIWFVQVVHYPLFQKVGKDSAQEYFKQHQLRTTYVVMPLMLVELAASILIAIDAFETGVQPVLGFTGLGLVALIWVSTFLVQVPMHSKLSSGFDTRLVKLLVSTNLVRTLAWSARGVISLLMLTNT